MVTFNTDKKFAEKLDREDPLVEVREQFLFPEHQEEVVYLCGNSLGLQPKTTRAFVEQELDDWARLGVRGHHPEFKEHSWIPYHEFCAPSLARLVGGSQQEVVAMNTLSVNLQLMLASFYQPTEKRFKVIRAYHPFPSDRYALATHLKFRGIDPAEGIIEVPPGDHEYFDMERFEELLESEADATALIIMDGVNYYTGQILPMERIAKVAKSKGITVGFDLAHGVGNAPLELHDWGVDFAVWCSYKYLNGGPGCVGGAFVHEEHATEFSRPRLAGWWGQDKAIRFQMGLEFKPIPGAEGWQLSNPPILPLAALRASLEIFDQVGFEALRKKSEILTGYLEFLLKESGCDLTVITPEHPNERGCQISLLLRTGGREVFERISEKGVFCDWREPNVIRVAPVPLYNRFQDVYRFVELLTEAMR